MNAIRKHFPDEIEALRPLLRAAYDAILAFQLDRVADREARMRDAIRATVPILSRFKPFVPGYKARYLELIERQEDLAAHDLVVCFDRGVYELHTRLPTGQFAHLPWSKELRDLLDERRRAEPRPAGRGERYLTSGTGIGRAVVAGTARRIERPDQFGRVRDGDIVVMPTADPEFVRVIDRIAGLVTDRGGRLCHAAILAREWNRTAVVGCGDATEAIADGRTIRLDPIAGLVFALDD